ncbi:MAG: carboxypeptidase-like regulatory domain-containing protein [Saprospiraceae bacterium]|nr:carboxypeptidase-like regulatory domain-containing protein [Saprospiraceae bacterium]
MKNLSLVLLALIWPYFLLAQIQDGITLSGVVTEAESGATVPFVNILLAGSGRGTVSNELGAFELKVSELPARLLISHVGYKRQQIEVQEVGTEIQVALEAAELQGVEVVAKKTNKIYQLIAKAMQRTKEQMEQDRYGRAFYRQVSKNDSIYSELYEIFYDTKFSANGISDWALQQGRYALQENNEGRGLVFNKNFTLIDRVFPTLDPAIEMFHTPISARVEDFYNLRTEKIIQPEEQEIALIHFTPKLDIVGKTPTLEGMVYIDLKTFDILKLSGRFASNELKVIAFRGKGKVDNYVLEYESAFQRGKEGELLLDYISAKQDFDVVYEDRPTKKVSTQSLLNVYEYYTPGRRDRKLGGRLNFKKSDAKAIDQKGYDKDFWKENAIVKRTPVEEAVIADFERNRQFGSIFLNNRNQVSFIPDIDKDPFIESLLQKMQVNAPIQEKIYLHLDKPYYAQGESIWFKAYLLDASFHRPLNASKAIWVDLVSPDGKVLVQQLLPVQGEGFSFGELKWQQQWQPGKYQLRAYTDRMKSFHADFFFKAEVELLGTSPLGKAEDADFDIQFFPEGGDLVNGLSSQLAFLAIDESGRAISVEGKIMDDQGKEIRKMNTPADGRNSIIFQPTAGRSYIAEVRYGKRSKRFDIPTALTEGYVMSVRNKRGKNIGVRVLSSAAKVDTEVYLIGQVRGRVYYKSKGVLSNRLLNFEIPRQLFPSGILHLSLMDAESKVYAERLCFLDQEDALQLKVDANKRNYGPRDEVVLAVKVKDVEGHPVQGNFSLAVTDAAQVKIPSSARDFRSYILMESDLATMLDAPNRYFEADNPKAERQLDLLMLTNGWRRFSWQDVLREKKVDNPFFAQGFEVCGSLGPNDVAKYKQADLALVIVGPTGGFYTTQADEEGRFCFYDVNFVDTTFLSVQAMLPNGQTADVEAIFEMPTPPTSTFSAPTENSQALTAEASTREKYQSIMKERQQEATVLNGDFVLLDEVVVKGNKITPQPSQSLHEREFADVVLDMDEQYKNHPNVLSVMEGKVPGMQVIDDGYRALIRITGGTNDPLVLFDGMPINSLNWTLPDIVDQAPRAGGGGDEGNQIGDSGTRMATAAASNSDDRELYNFLRTLNPRTVDRIEVLKGANAAMYGVRGANGVIAIYSKSGAYDPGGSISGNAYPGYYSAREFYVPKYNSTDAGLSRKDRRSTLYWNPNIQTDENGKAEIRFFNTDIAKGFTIDLEGVSNQGEIGTLRIPIEGNR